MTESSIETGAVTEREVLGFTIDGSDSQDLDDAIWVERTDTGVRVTVSISAAAHRVTKNSGLDQRALDRVETSYGRTGNYPMLPRGIAENTASLFPGAPRRVVVTTIDLDCKLVVRSSAVSLGHLTSAAKLSYRDVPAILRDSNHVLHTQMCLCVQVAEGLVERRRSAGAFVFYDLNQGWVTTEEGAVKKLKDTTETIGYIVVQELMILANVVVAELCAREEIPIPFRNHTARAHAPDRNEIMEQLVAGIHEPLRGLEVLQRRLNLVMNRADYGATLRGHYGLNLPAYAHSTSPIRRYADLVTQRQLIAYVQGQELPHTREEVEHLCRVINSTLEAKRAAATDREKERANEQARGSLAGNLDLAALSAKDFERVVKVVVREGTYTPTLTDAFVARMAQGTINVIDLYFGIIETRAPAWKPLHEVIFKYLLENPQLVPSIVSMATNLREWSSPEFMSQASGPDHARVHTVTVRVSLPQHLNEGWPRSLMSPPATHSTVKMAKQQAMLLLLAQAVDFLMPDFESAPGEAFDEPSPPAPQVPETTDNPIAALQEHAQKIGLAMPEYTTVRVSGDDHAPQFVCTCKFEGVSVEGATASSKKTAKRLAAEVMVAKLQEAMVR